MATKGVVMFATNNSHIEYLKLAAMNARLIAKHMKVPVSLITNTEGSTHPSFFGLDVFDQVIIDDSVGNVNLRTYRDTKYYQVTSDFKNFSRPSVYDLSPYDETILLDVDYIIQDDSLNACWNSLENIMINNNALSLDMLPLTGEEYRLNPFGIRMYWATVIYFKKSEQARILFDMVKHIKDHWEFYHLIYNFPNIMYRNDYAFSIAIHTMSGFIDSGEIKPLPVPYILTATDKDQLYDVKGDNLLFFVNDKAQGWLFNIIKTNGQNVHCMNKISLLRNLEKLENTTK